MIKFRATLVAAAVGMSLALTACGDDSSTQTDAKAYDLTATAIDGYLKNAKITAVCDGIEDPIDADTLTDNEGQAGFFIDGAEADDCEITVTSTADTVDVETGKTFKEDELYLTAPKGKKVASPFTTLVAAKVKASGGSLDVDSAIAEVAVDLGIDLEDVDLLTGDYIKAANDSSDTGKQLKAKKAKLKAMAVMEALPKKVEEFNELVEEAKAGNSAKLDKLNAKLDAIIEKAEEKIEDALNKGKDLNDITFSVTITIDDDGKVVVVIETKDKDDDDNGTGGTGTGSGSGGEGSFLGTGA